MWLVTVVTVAGISRSRSFTFTSATAYNVGERYTLASESALYRVWSCEPI